MESQKRKALEQCKIVPVQLKMLTSVYINMKFQRDWNLKTHSDGYSYLWPIVVYDYETQTKKNCSSARLTQFLY